ncbi:transcription factor HES-5-like [Sphaeramia orbicularis]|uniref:transcription factor HES-5-like n=1 Tax=Sphaeramia orbicularis TaxID=375764 RepID=UPI00117F0394|nr:transcription factor HES-5-like [Sphaeramia orbicularis]XP_029990559.1 transcription factor HES-5-like [Sphaeramia orbicularis]
MKPAQIRLSLHRPPQHTHPTMAPTITAAMTNSEEHLTLTHKLRKPLVEKLRRERINSSIEQLKSLLGPEFLQQQPDSKMEKADILEMTVCFLRRPQQQHHVVDSAAVDQIHSTCVQEMVNFPSAEELKTPSQLNHCNNRQFSSDKILTDPDFYVHTSITKDKSPVNSAPWRPW